MIKKTNLTKILIFIISTCCFVLNSQVIPDTEDTMLRTSAAPQPGWFNDNGSCDCSSDTQWGFNGDPFIGGAYPPPTGHSYFMTCGSWDGGESAMGTITGLTIGEQYAFTFYVAGFRMDNIRFGDNIGDSYNITVGDESSGDVNFTSVGWISQTFTFTADATSEPIIVRTTSNSSFRTTHYSFTSSSVTVACFSGNAGPSFF